MPFDQLICAQTRRPLHILSTSDTNPRWRTNQSLGNEVFGDSWGHSDIGSTGAGKPDQFWHSGSWCRFGRLCGSGCVQSEAIAGIEPAFSVLQTLGCNGLGEPARLGEDGGLKALLTSRGSAKGAIGSVLNRGSRHLRVLRQQRRTSWFPLRLPQADLPRHQRRPALCRLELARLTGLDQPK